jgi:hypothetical protein
MIYTGFRHERPITPREVAGVGLGPVGIVLKDPGPYERDHYTF